MKNEDQQNRNEQQKDSQKDSQKTEQQKIADGKRADQLKRDRQKINVTDNKLRLIGVACLLLGVLFLFLYFKLSSHSDQDLNAPPSLDLTDSGPVNDQSLPGSDPSNGNLQGSLSSDVGAAGGVSGSVGKAREGSQISDKLKADLMRFQVLYGKAVLTPEEESEMTESLKNGNLIREVGQLLRNHKIMDEPNFSQLQMAGIDFLKQALQNGDEDAVRDSVWEIIRDPLIEDKNIPIDDRKAMSMPKAELLYHASALRPDLFPDIDMDLPGPVSQQIWKNVQRRQSDNLEESIDEAQKFEKEKDSN